MIHFAGGNASAFEAHTEGLREVDETMRNRYVIVYTATRAAGHMDSAHPRFLTDSMTQRPTATFKRPCRPAQPEGTTECLSP